MHKQIGVHRVKGSRIGHPKIWDFKRPQRAKTIFGKEIKVGGAHLLTVWEHTVTLALRYTYRRMRTSLAVQWLRLRTSTARARVQSLVWELRSYKLRGMAKTSTTTNKNI